MPGSLHLDDFPPELLGKIFWNLTVPDMSGLKLVRPMVSFPPNLLNGSPIKVNRTFHNVVSDQPHLQYKCELAAAGLLDNPNTSGTLFDRRARLHKYRSRFDSLEPISKSSLPLGVTGLTYGYDASGGVFVIHTPERSTLHFCQPPSVSESQPMKTWSLPLSFEVQQFAIYPPLDLIVLADLM